MKESTRRLVAMAGGLEDLIGHFAGQDDDTLGSAITLNALRRLQGQLDGLIFAVSREEDWDGQARRLLDETADWDIFQVMGLDETAPFPSVKVT